MSQAELQIGAIGNREAGLRQSLTGGQLAMIAIGGAIGTGLFLGSGFAIGFAGPGVLLSYAIGAIIALGVMGALAEMTVVHATTGSFGTWAELYLGHCSGFVVRYSYWTAVVLGAGTEVVALGVYMRYWFPGTPAAAWIALFAAALLLINGLRVEVFGSIEWLFSAVKIAAIVVFLLLGAWVIARAPVHSPMGFGNYTSHGGFLPHGLWGVCEAALVALFSYFGVEMIAVAAGEARNPQRAIQKAFRATFARLAGFYLLTIALILAIVPWDQSGHVQSPFVTVMARSGIPYAADVINAVLLIAALSAVNSLLYAAARFLFSLARAGDAPRSFGRIDGRGIPLRALIASGAGIGIGAWLSIVYGDAAFPIMLGISSFGAIVAWTMIFVTHIAFRRAIGDQPRSFSMWGYPWTSMGGILLLCAILLTTPFVPGFRTTLAFGLPFLLLLLLAYWLRSRSRVSSTAAGAEPARVPSKVP